MREVMRGRWALAAVLAVGCGSSSPGAPSVVLASIFQTPTSLPGDQAAFFLAVDDINASGVFDRPFKAVGATFDDTTDRTQLARDLIEKQHAVGLLAFWSSTAKAALQVTGRDHPDVTVCSGSSTAAFLNDPTVSDDTDGTINADHNGTLFRTAPDDQLQARVLWALAPDKTAVGIFSLDDPYGADMAKVVDSLAKGGATPLVFIDTFPETLTDASIQPHLDAILSANRAGTLKTLILVTLSDQSERILKGLVEPSSGAPFAGRILFSDGGTNAAAFPAQTAAFAAWLAAGNTLIGIAPDATRGDNSAAWIARMQARNPSWDQTGTTAPSSADCAYSWAIAAMHGQGNARYEAATMKAHLPDFTHPIAASDAVTVSPSAAGLRDARDAIAAGKAVRLDGASGVVDFDANGDRYGGVYGKWVVKGTGGGFDGPWTWDEVELWDPVAGACLQAVDGGACH